MDQLPLTEDQKRAVHHGKGSACVIAGAGTGKTTALSERIFHSVEETGLEPNRILITTFTRKATAELYNRAYRRLGEVAQKLRISTIDALIWELAQQATHRGLMPSVRLVGEADRRVLLLHCAWEVFGQVMAYSRSSWTKTADEAGLIDLLEKRIRMEMAEEQKKQDIKQSIRSSLEKMKNRFRHCFNFKTPTPQELKRTAKKYFEKLNKLGATDYDLLGRDFLKCLKQHKKLAKEFASEFDAILVDEFQDTSHVQVETLLLLSGKRRSIWVVGDPCQQIYEWRGAEPGNLLRFIKEARAKRYHLTDNWRSTQPILDCAYHFLSHRVPALEKNGMLKPLKSRRDDKRNKNDNHPIYTGTLDRTLFFIKQLSDSNPDLKPSDIAILSKKLDKRTRTEIEEKTIANGLKIQFHSSRADRTLEQTIGDPPSWRPGTTLKNLYGHPKIKRLILGSLRKRNFSDLRTLRPLATAAEALDSTLPSQAFTFREAWPALKKTQDREVSVTPAVVSRPDAIQVMTIHAAKGLEFSVVLLMKLGNGGPGSFPNPKDPEDNRLVYVGATRARDLLILVHGAKKPHNTLSAFGGDLSPIRRNKREIEKSKIEAPTVLSAPPIIAATHLDLYEQCPLKFAAYHEGGFLPKWTIPQSKGARIHKALEYYLRAEMPTNRHSIVQCFERGFQDGDSPLRKWKRMMSDKGEMKKTYKEMVKNILKTTVKVLAIEQRYRYLQGNSGQIEGVVDAVIERQDGSIVLREWKTSAGIASDKRRPYELQARAGALGIATQNSHSIQFVEIVPVAKPENAISLPYNGIFFEESNHMFEKVFKDLRDRNFDPRRGNHCKSCGLKPQCPAWHKS